MAIARTHRFPITMLDAFPRGLVLVGDIEQALEYTSDRNATPRQRIDAPVEEGGTGLPLWSANVTDPSEPKAKKASFAVLVASSHQPVPVNPEVLPGMRAVEFDGLTCTPRVAGQGEYKSLSYQFFATGITGDSNTPRASVPSSKPSAQPATAPSTKSDKAA